MWGIREVLKVCPPTVFVSPCLASNISLNTVVKGLAAFLLLLSQRQICVTIVLLLPILAQSSLVLFCWADPIGVRDSFLLLIIFLLLLGVSSLSSPPFSVSLNHSPTFAQSLRKKLILCIQARTSTGKALLLLPRLPRPRLVKPPGQGPCLCCTST